MPGLIASFLGIQAQFKVFHWQTSSYSRHIAYGSIYETLDGLVDTFMEAYMGKYGRPTLNDQTDSILLSNIGETNMEEYLTTVSDFFCSLTEMLDAKDTDLLNIRDEMIAAVSKLKYLLTLK